MELDIMLRYFYQLTLVPMALYDDDLLIRLYSSNAFFPNPSLHEIKSLLDTDQSIGFVISPEYLFCGFVRIQGSNQYIVLGPAMEFVCSNKLAEQILKNLKESSIRTHELLCWFNTIPFVTPTQFIANLKFLNYIINGDDPALGIGYEEVLSTESLHTVNPNSVFTNRSNSLLEKEMLSCIEHGRVEELKNALRKIEISDTTLAAVADYSERAFKNIIVVSTALAARGAIKGGLDQDTALTLSDYYLKKMEILHTYTELHRFLCSMLIDYAERTARCQSLHIDSSLVLKVYKDISCHIYEKNSVAAIAKRLDFNRSYLCRQFKRKTGKTISDYINDVKIKEAQRLLLYTDFSLVQIAAQLDFSSQHYFHTVFKKITGITPTNFRSSSKN